ncbi:hypothetical protein CG431_20285 [Pantoea ananatis]|nr:hypothetical protein CG427_20755 [Pantoea ananatis]PQK82948.1 hypothetical protein CG431_20285 [Pantoea ananatis]PWK05731.1 hypothetical protein C7421_11210 [Pantoea ananatis]
MQHQVNVVDRGYTNSAFYSSRKVLIIVTIMYNHFLIKVFYGHFEYTFNGLFFIKAVSEILLAMKLKRFDGLKICTSFI